MDTELFAAHLEWAEDRRTFPYLDTATPPKISIGVGRNLTDRGLSDAEIDFLKANDIRAAINDAMTLPYWQDLDDVRQLVVADLIFNLGLPKWLQFAKANAALEVHDYNTAANELIDSLWYRQVGRRARRLVDAMGSGEWPHGKEHRTTIA